MVHWVLVRDLLHAVERSQRADQVERECGRGVSEAAHDVDVARRLRDARHQAQDGLDGLEEVESHLLANRWKVLTAYVVGD